MKPGVALRRARGARGATSRAESLGDKEGGHTDTQRHTQSSQARQLGPGAMDTTSPPSLAAALSAYMRGSRPVARGLPPRQGSRPESSQRAAGATAASALAPRGGRGGSCDTVIKRRLSYDAASRGGLGQEAAAITPCAIPTTATST